MSLLPKGSVEGLTEKSTQPADSHKFYLGAAWDGNVDLDLMVVPVHGDAVATDDVCYFNRLSSLGGAIKHSGDALTGEDDDGDDESVVIHIEAVPQDVTAIVIGVIAYSVNDMSEATNTKFTIRDGDKVTAPELYTLPMSDDDVDGETILVSCVLTRTGYGFSVKNVGEFRTDFGKGMDAVQGLVQISPAYV